MYKLKIRIDIIEVNMELYLEYKYIKYKDL